MYGPPRDCKRKVRFRELVCENVPGLSVEDTLAIMRIRARSRPFKLVRS